MAANTDLKIVHASTAEDYQDAKKLIMEYVASLGFKLTFQDYDKEITHLSERYSAPKGDLLLAYVDGKLAGTVAVHEFKPGSAEMKRLFVRSEFRHYGVGKKLIAEIIKSAKALNYDQILLDTLEKMQSAVNLYHKFGFKNITAYRYNPLKGALFMKKTL